MPPKQKPRGMPGKYLPNSNQQAGQGQRPIKDGNVNSAVKRAQGREEERKASRKTIYVDLGAVEEEINLDQEVIGEMGLKGDIQQVVANAVQAASSQCSNAFHRKGSHRGLCRISEGEGESSFSAYAI